MIKSSEFRMTRRLSKFGRRLTPVELKEATFYIDRVIDKEKEYGEIRYKVIGSQTTGISRSVKRDGWDLDIFVYEGLRDGKEFYLAGYLATKVYESYPHLFEYDMIHVGSPGELRADLYFLIFREGKYKDLRIDFLDDYVFDKGAFSSLEEK